MRGDTDHRDVGPRGGLDVPTVPDRLRPPQELLYALQRRDGIVGQDEATAATGIDAALLEGLILGLVAISADHRDNLALGVQGQNVVLVLEEHCAVDDDTLRNILVRLRDRPRAREQPALAAGEAPLELTCEVHRRQHVPGHRVHDALRHGALADQRRQRVEVLALGHLHIQTVVSRPRCGVGRTPIGDHKAFEAELLAQQLLQDSRILASVLSGNLVVGAHHRAGARLEGCLEHLHVDFVLRPSTDLDSHRLPVDLLVVVQPMLHCGDDTPVLHGLDKHPDELAAQVRILARQRLEASAGKRCARDLDVGAQQDVRPLGDELLRDGCGVLIDRLPVEGGR
mmetsp:Transcript_40952/g.117642  ORF Transcript_40952/g.117642 Transcript_40952/m.117642 type:complete len:341 (+) Transcript_40952:1061-2083(+)